MPRDDESSFASLKKSASSFDSALSNLLFSTPGKKQKSSMKSIYSSIGEGKFADVSSDDFDTEDDCEVIDGGTVSEKSIDDKSDDSNPMSMNSSCDEEDDDDDLSDDDNVESDSETNGQSDESIVQSSDEDEVLSEESSDEAPKKKKQKTKTSAPRPKKATPAVPLPVPMSRMAKKLKDNPKPIRGKGRPPRDKLGPFDPASFTPKPFKRDQKEKEFLSRRCPSKS